LLGAADLSLRVAYADTGRDAEITGLSKRGSALVAALATT
jgi:hypothetical protein